MKIDLTKIKKCLEDKTPIYGLDEEINKLIHVLRKAAQDLVNQIEDLDQRIKKLEELHKLFVSVEARNCNLHARLEKLEQKEGE